MGNSLKQLDQKIGRDKLRSVHSSYKDQIQEEKEQDKGFFGRLKQKHKKRTKNRTKIRKQTQSQQSHKSIVNQEIEQSQINTIPNNGVYDEIFQYQSLNEQLSKNRALQFEVDLHLDPSQILSQITYKWTEMSSQHASFGRVQQFQGKSSNMNSMQNRNHLSLTTQNNQKQLYSLNSNQGHSSRSSLNSMTSHQIIAEKVHLYQSGQTKNTNHKSSKDVNRQQVHLSQHKHSPKDLEYAGPSYHQQHSPNDQFAQQTLQIDRSFYSWRVNIAKYSLGHSPNQLPIVHVYEVKQQAGLSILELLNLQVFRPKVSCFVQYIPVRLREIRSLTHLQGLYVFEQALLGFKLLFQIFGYFIIEENMIGFTVNGQVKVWISCYFQSNKCHRRSNLLNVRQNINYSHINQSQYDQQEMVTTIWMIVQKYSLFHQSLVVESSGFRVCNFKRAFQVLIRHKQNILKNRSVNQVGLVKFVEKLTFQGGEGKSQKGRAIGNRINDTYNQRDLDYMRQQNHRRSKNAKDLSSSLYGSICHKQTTNTQEQHNSHKSFNNFKQPKKCKYNSNNKDQPFNHSYIKPQLQPSHIKILAPTKKQSYGTNLNQLKNRPLIFDKGYEQGSMDNNRNSISQGQRYNQSNNSYYNQQHEQSSLQKHVRFVNIKSLHC